MTEGYEFNIRKFVRQFEPETRQLWYDCLSRPRYQFNYRDVLMREGDARTHGYLLMSGSVMLTKKIVSNKKAMLAETQAMDILGSDHLYDRDPCHFYTFTVSSSTAYCISLSAEEVIYLSRYNYRSIVDKESRRREDMVRYTNKMSRSLRKIYTKQVHEQVLRSYLPYIQTLQNSPQKKFNKKPKISPFKGKLFDEIIYLPKTHLKIMSRTPNKSVYHAPSPEKLFRENLKNIIRRKISYETKQFAVLKFFRRSEMQNNEQAAQQPGNQNQLYNMVEGPINRFFNLESMT